MRRLIQGLVVLVLSGVISILPVVNPPVRAADVTDLVVQVESGNPINLYFQPSVRSLVLRTIGQGNRMTWDGTYTAAEGRNWMPVEIMGQKGWITPENSIIGMADPTRITPGIDRSTIVSPTTNAMTLYAAPGRSSQAIGTVRVGEQFKVIDAAVVVDLYTWWPVQRVNGTQQGWLVDTGAELKVLTPLAVYNYPVCDNFDLKRFGVAGWDSIINSLPSLIPSNETIQCLASSNLRQNNTPIVIILTKVVNASNQSVTYDVLRIFEQRGNVWTTIFQARTQDFERTERVSLHDLVGDGLPVLLWAVRVDGTGHILKLALLRFNTAGQLEVVLGTTAYKGSFQIVPGLITVSDLVIAANEPNCCLSHMHSVNYQWQVNRFVAVKERTFIVPWYVQGIPNF